MGQIFVSSSLTGRARRLTGEPVDYEMTIGYTKPDLAPQAKALVRRVSRKITKVAKERRLHVPSIYMNGADSEQKVFQSYGEKNLAKLRTISVKYDPAGTFRRLVGGFEF